MKRELKETLTTFPDTYSMKNCKAHPDEKGTERPANDPIVSACLQDCKAHPDEKGTERGFGGIEFSDHSDIARPIPMKRELKDDLKRIGYWPKIKDCKAHPDEKGTESELADGLRTALFILQGPSR